MSGCRRRLLEQFSCSSLLMGCAGGTPLFPVVSLVLFFFHYQTPAIYICYENNVSRDCQGNCLQSHSPPPSLRRPRLQLYKIHNSSCSSCVCLVVWGTLSYQMYAYFERKYESMYFLSSAFYAFGVSGDGLHPPRGQRKRAGQADIL